jgi:hypothetical protein
MSDRPVDERNWAEGLAKQGQTAVSSAPEFALWQQSVFSNHAATTKETLCQPWEKLSSLL